MCLISLPGGRRSFSDDVEMEDDSHHRHSTRNPVNTDTKLEKTTRRHQEPVGFGVGSNGMNVESWNKLDDNKGKPFSRSISKERSMYSIHNGFTDRGDILTYFFQYKNEDVTFEKALSLFESGMIFSEIVSETIEDCQHFPNVHLEFPPVSLSSAGSTVFKIALVKDRSLSNLQCDPNAFRRKMSHCDPEKRICTFRDDTVGATVIAPHTDGALQAGHMGEFLQKASVEVKHEFWKEVAACLKSQLLENHHKPLWLSSGRSKAWFHMQLNGFVPHYYRFEPFMQFRTPQARERQQRIGKHIDAYFYILLLHIMLYSYHITSQILM